KSVGIWKMREERETPSARTYVCYGLLPCDRARERVPDRCNTSGSAVDVSSDALAWGQRVSTRRMAVLSTFPELSVCRQVHRELMRSAALDLTPIIPATACHQRNYVERYSRFRPLDVECTGPGRQKRRFRLMCSAIRLSGGKKR